MWIEFFIWWCWTQLDSSLKYRSPPQNIYMVSRKKWDNSLKALEGFNKQVEDEEGVRLD